MTVYPLYPVNPYSRRVAWCLVDNRDVPALVRWVATLAARAGVSKYTAGSPSVFDPRYIVRYAEQPAAGFTAAAMAGRPILVLRDPSGHGTQYYTILDRASGPRWYPSM